MFNSIFYITISDRTLNDRMRGFVADRETEFTALAFRRFPKHRRHCRVIIVARVQLKCCKFQEK